MPSRVVVRLSAFTCLLVSLCPGAVAIEGAAAGEVAAEGARVPLAGPLAPARKSAAPPTAAVRAWRTDAALVGVGQLGDLVSTEIALARPGTREANPLMENRGIRVTAKLAAATAASLACRDLRRRGRGREARILSIGLFVVGAALTAHNLRVANGG